ncbi:PDC sensor domain-containing protein [Pantoea sp. 18069]|uniref:PDC sensor domain-containing protein n=1 Tax=Pantoea sp. 18069 TaxID=2681415 RepID=UPI00135A1D13|nr:PDC sensor domain-containing protein [Pantoea sp. 18069]
MSTRTPNTPPRAFAGPLLEVGGLWLLIVLSGVLLIAGLLDHWRQQELQTMERAQLELTLLEIKDELEGELSLGTELQHTPRIQDLLESHLQKDPQLYSLDVLDQDGRALFSTDRGTVGEPLPPLAQAAALQGAARHRPWHALIESTPMMGVDMRTPFGETAGHVSATYASRATDYLSDPILTPALLLGLLATALAGMAAIWLATAPQRRLRQAQSLGRLAQIDAQLAATGRRLDDGSQRLDAVERIE